MAKLSLNQILKTFLIFIISYSVFLVLWIQVKDYYGYGMTLTASRIIAGLKDLEIDAVDQNDERVQVTFTPYRINKNILIDIPVRTNTYTFNSPLTLGIMATLFLFIRRRVRAYAEAIVLLLIVHQIFIMTFELKELTSVLMNMKLETVSNARKFVYDFLWSFTDNMVIRFEPFLIGFYLFVRFRKS
jgi:hypothetical protein